ncbi:MAG: transposase [Planctomycetaceae bacterium]
MRLITLALDQPTRDKETHIRLLTNLPARQANACKVAELYRQRWTIESMFQELTQHLRPARSQEAEAPTPLFRERKTCRHSEDTLSMTTTKQHIHRSALRPDSVVEPDDGDVIRIRRKAGRSVGRIETSRSRIYNWRQRAVQRRHRGEGSSRSHSQPSG